MVGQVIKFKKKTKTGFETRWGIMDPKDPSKILRSYKTRAEAEKSAKVDTGAAKMTDNRCRFHGTYSKMCKKPSLKESIELLERNGYSIINECGDCEGADCFYEIEDALESAGADPETIQRVMTEYATEITDMLEQGKTPEEIADNLADLDGQDYNLTGNTYGEEPYNFYG